MVWWCCRLVPDYHSGDFTFLSCKFYNPNSLSCFLIISSAWSYGPGVIHAASLSLLPRSIIVIVDALADSLANQFCLTSKEDREVDVGEGGSESDSDSVAATYDLVGRVISGRSFSAHTLQLNIERLLRP